MLPWNRRTVPADHPVQSFCISTVISEPDIPVNAPSLFQMTPSDNLNLVDKDEKHPAPISRSRINRIPRCLIRITRSRFLYLVSFRITNHGTHVTLAGPVRYVSSRVSYTRGGNVYRGARFLLLFAAGAWTQRGI